MLIYDIILPEKRERKISHKTLSILLIILLIVQLLGGLLLFSKEVIAQDGTPPAAIQFSCF